MLQAPPASEEPPAAAFGVKAPPPYLWADISEEAQPGQDGPAASAPLTAVFEQPKTPPPAPAAQSPPSASKPAVSKKPPFASPPAASTDASSCRSPSAYAACAS